MHRTVSLAASLAVLALVAGLVGCGSSDAPKLTTAAPVLDSRFTEDIRSNYVSSCVEGAIATDDPVGLCEAQFDCTAARLGWDDFVAADQSLSGKAGRRAVTVMKECAAEALAAQ